MIYYPLSTLMLFGIKDILIISTPEDLPNIEYLLGNGSNLGISINYAIQEEPRGIAEAFIIGAPFIGNDNVCLILGDNIFYLGEHINKYIEAIHKHENSQATIFAYHVSNPKQFGVIEFDNSLNVKSIEEKPLHPKSSFVSVGLYFYPSDVIAKANKLSPSKRNELEITDLNNMYLTEGRLQALPLLRGHAWLDAGTPDSLIDSSNFVQIIEKRQGLKIACLEEIAYKKGYINANQLQDIIDSLSSGNYRDYLIKVLADDYEFY